MASIRPGAYHERMESKAELRQELTEAVARVRQQMDVQRRSVSYLGVGMPDGGAVATAQLEAELAQLEDALADLGSDDA